MEGRMANSLEDMTEIPGVLHEGSDLAGEELMLNKGYVPWPEDRPSAQTELVEWAQDVWQRWKYRHAGYTWFDWLKSFVPFIGVVQNYSLKRHAVGDIIAGLTVGAMLVPQGLSYAKLAGLPSVFGLYGGFLPILVYSLLGSSRQLGVGPVAVTSMLLGSGIPNVIDAKVQANPNQPADPAAQQEYNAAAIQVAFLAGLMYTAAGILNLGWITNFLSHAVLSGFTTGACLIIGLNQAKYIFGYSTHPGATKTAPAVSFPRNDPINLQLASLLSSEWLPYFRWEEFVMGMSWIIFILVMRQLGKLHPILRFCSHFSSLFVVILSTALVASFGWDGPPVKISTVGKIPAGLPGPTVSWFFPMKNFGQKLLLALIVCLIDMLESISIARALALRHGYELNASTELRGMGIANIFGACFSCYTTTGSFSRSSVNSSTGAKTQVAGFITSMVIMIVLLVATPLFTKLPLNAMAAIVIAAMPPLFNWREFLFLWKVNKFDCLVFTTSFFCVAFLGVEYGLAIAVGLSLLIVIFNSAFPNISVMGNLPGTSMYRNVRLFPEATEVDGFLIIRVDSPFYFANVTRIASRIEYHQHRRHGPIHYLILDLTAVSHMDSSAIHLLERLVKEQGKKDSQLVLVQPNQKVIATLIRSGLDELIGRQFIFMEVHDAVRYCQRVDGVPYDEHHTSVDYCGS